MLIETKAFSILPPSICIVDGWFVIVQADLSQLHQAIVKTQYVAVVCDSLAKIGLIMLNIIFSVRK